MSATEQFRFDIQKFAIFAVHTTVIDRRWDEDHTYDCMHCYMKEYTKYTTFRSSCNILWLMAFVMLCVCVCLHYHRCIVLLIKVKRNHNSSSIRQHIHNYTRTSYDVWLQHIPCNVRKCFGNVCRTKLVYSGNWVGKWREFTRLQR